MLVYILYLISKHTVTIIYLYMDIKSINFKLFSNNIKTNFLNILLI